MSEAFRARYGKVAVVAGASEGLGAAFADAIAARGLDVVLVARRKDKLDEVAGRCVDRGVAVRTVAVDVADPGFAGALAEATVDLEVGLAVFNAAFAPIGALLDRPVDDALRAVDVNAKGPIRLVHALAPAMVARGRGGVVLMSSVAGFQGGPRIAAYAATKAFTIALGEALWAELAPKGVDVVVSCPGAIRTPGYAGVSAKEAPGTLDAAYVAEKTLDGLGRGPTLVPGAVNAAARFVLGRLLTRAAAVSIMGRSTADLAG